MAKRQYALLAAEREKECPHELVAYRGTIPNTGPRICRMCGTINPKEAKKTWLRCEDCHRHNFVEVSDFQHIEDSAARCPECGGKMKNNATHRPRTGWR